MGAGPATVCSMLHSPFLSKYIFIIMMIIIPFMQLSQVHQDMIEHQVILPLEVPTQREYSGLHQLK